MNPNCELSPASYFISRYLHAKYQNDKLKVFKILFRIQEFFLCRFVKPLFGESFQGNLILSGLDKFWPQISKETDFNLNLLQKDPNVLKMIEIFKDLGPQFARIVYTNKLREEIGRCLGYEILEFVDLVEEVFSYEREIKLSDEYKPGSAWSILRSQKLDVITNDHILDVGKKDPYFLEFKRRHEKIHARLQEWSDQQLRPWARNNPVENISPEAKAFLEKWKTSIKNM